MATPLLLETFQGSMDAKLTDAAAPDDRGGIGSVAWTLGHGSQDESVTTFSGAGSLRSVELDGPDVFWNLSPEAVASNVVIWQRVYVRDDDYGHLAFYFRKTSGGAYYRVGSFNGAWIADRFVDGQVFSKRFWNGVTRFNLTSGFHDLALRCVTNGSGNVEVSLYYDNTEFTDIAFTDSDAEKVTAAGNQGFWLYNTGALPTLGTEIVRFATFNAADVSWPPVYSEYEAGTVETSPTSSSIKVIGEDSSAGSYRKIISTGNEVRGEVTGTSVLGLKFDVSTWSGTTFDDEPLIQVRFNEGSWFRMRLRYPFDTPVMLQGLSPAESYSFQVRFDGGHWGDDWWNSPVGLKLDKLVMEAGGSVTTLRNSLTPKPVVGICGDSLVYGSRILSTNDTTGASAQLGFARLLADLINRDLYAVGKPTQGILYDGGGNVPRFYTAAGPVYAIDSISNGVSRTIPSNMTDFFFVHGSNDGLWQNSTPITTEYQACLAHLRSILPVGCRIWACVPPGGFKRAQITSGYNNYITASSDALCYLLDRGSGGDTGLNGPFGTPTAQSVDGVHLNTQAHIDYAGDLYDLAVAIEPDIVYGAPPDPTIDSVDTPTSGEILLTGISDAITWTSSDVDNVDILLSRDGGSTYPITIVSSEPNTGSYSYTPTTDHTTAMARVMVRSSADALVFAESDTFKIATTESTGGGTQPDVPTFTVVDNADGTATVTIAGSTTGATNTVYSTPVDDQWPDPTPAWTSRGSRVGNGTVTITIPRGIYFLAIKSEL